MLNAALLGDVGDGLAMFEFGVGTLDAIGRCGYEEDGVTSFNCFEEGGLGV